MRNKTIVNTCGGLADRYVFYKLHPIYIHIHTYVSADFNNLTNEYIRYLRYKYGE